MPICLIVYSRSTQFLTIGFSHKWQRLYITGALAQRRQVCAQVSPPLLSPFLAISPSGDNAFLHWVPGKTYSPEAAISGATGCRHSSRNLRRGHVHAVSYLRRVYPEGGWSDASSRGLA